MYGCYENEHEIDQQQADRLARTCHCRATRTYVILSVELDSAWRDTKYNRVSLVVSLVDSGITHSDIYDKIRFITVYSRKSISSSIIGTVYLYLANIYVEIQTTKLNRATVGDLLPRPASSDGRS